MKWAEFGGWTALGLLIGIGVVVFFAPREPGGVALAMLIGLALAMVLRGLVGFVLSRRR
jgi:hypothetical protein